MSLNVAGLATYTDENKLALIKKSILGGRTLNFITVQPDIKSAAAINIIDSTLTAAAGACGWSAAGTTALTQRELAVCPLKVNESICLDTLESYYTQKMMNAGSYNEEIPFEALFADEKAGKINALIDDLIWKGDTATGAGNLALCNGFIQLFTKTAASASTVNGNTAAVTALTASNIVDVIDRMVANVPTDIIDADDLVLFLGYDAYRLYAQALRNANLYHYEGAEGNDFTMFVPGTNVRLVAVRGLNGTNKMYLSKASNFYFGTDLLNDAESFEIFYDKNDDEVRFRAKWKQGVQVAFPEFVVAFKLA